MIRVLGLVAVALVVLAGCDAGDLTLDQVDPDAVPAEPTFDQVFSIFQRECAPCHTDSKDDDEPDEPQGRSPSPVTFGGAAPDYSTCAGIIANLDDALGAIFGNNNMPPGAWPRLTSEEKLIIERWVQQWDDGGQVSPCN